MFQLFSFQTPVHALHDCQGSGRQQQHNAAITATYPLITTAAAATTVFDEEPEKEAKEKVKAAVAAGGQRGLSEQQFTGSTTDSWPYFGQNCRWSIAQDY